MNSRHGTGSRSSQRGAALLILLTIVLLATTYAFVSRLSAINLDTERQARTTTALAQAKDALIGFAVTYRDSHPNEVFGFLPCPDGDNNGVADSCGATDITLIGRLPWQTLALPPLRDSDGECLWYAVSGTAKDAPKTAAFNWDTTGQLVVQDAPGTTTLAGVTAHERPFAVVLAARGGVGGQTRTSVGAPTECGGSLTRTDYLEGITISAAAGATSTVKLSTSDSAHNGTNNDRGAWITSKDVFDRVKKRSDFKNDIDALVNDLANCLNNLPPTSIPLASTGNKGIDNATSLCPVVDPLKANVLNNWRDNLLYAGGPAGSYTVNGSPTTCRALLFFGGERTTRTVAPLIAQTRITAAEKGDLSTFGDATMYLEGTNAAFFPANGAYIGATQYDATSASADIVRCINGLPAGSASFASDFASFVPAGAGVSTDTATAPSAPTVSIADASGISGGCFWFPNLIPLAGKTLRAYYEFKFFYTDEYALIPLPIPLGSPPDRGNGFTFQLLSDFGAPSSCGREVNMGVLKPMDGWPYSFIVETDVHRDTVNADPVGNHTAIMINGTLDHAILGTPGPACNGTTNGCLHSPANKLEDSPTPLIHNQRIEIHSGCNATCTICNPATHAAPNTYARISAWVDCTNCNDVVVDLNRAPASGGQVPTVFRCEDLSTPSPNQNVLNSVHVGFTGGFRSGATAGEAPAQGVTIRNFSLRSD